MSVDMQCARSQNEQCRCQVTHIGCSVNVRNLHTSLLRQAWSFKCNFKRELFSSVYADHSQ